MGIVQVINLSESCTDVVESEEKPITGDESVMKSILCVHAPLCPCKTKIHREEQMGTLLFNLDILYMIYCKLWQQKVILDGK